MNNHLSPSFTEHKKGPQHMTLEIQVLAWDRHKNVVGLNQLMGSQPSPLGVPSFGIKQQSLNQNYFSEVPFDMN